MWCGLKTPPRARRAPSCAVLAVPCQLCRGGGDCARHDSSASGTSPVAMPCTDWHQSKGKQEPRGPWGSPWPPVLSLWCLAAAKHSSVLPRGPWPQIRRGAGLAATLTGSGCGGDAVLSPAPAALKGGKLAVWPGLVAARVQHYNAWLRDQQGPSRARGPAGTQLPPRASWPPLPSWGQAGAKLRRGDGAGSSTVSNGDGAPVALPTRGSGRGRAWGRGGSVPRPMAQWQAGSLGLAALCAGVRR